MSPGPHQPWIPPQPLEGGRDASAVEARAVRRLEARAAAERRHVRADAYGIVDLAPPSAVELSPVETRTRTRSLAWLQPLIDVVLRRSGPAGHR